ncbi:MAG TPA: hypothetical protein VFE96_08000 [Candidatus Bathyarchaeia archaeon]|nr:hypothetical protein [Candidatus Bathyarchaeia archaeon]
MLGKFTAFVGFLLIAGPGLLAINGNIDTATFTALFIAGFVLLIVSSSVRA